jgi:hypothetical protein
VDVIIRERPERMVVTALPFYRAPRQ